MDRLESDTYTFDDALHAIHHLLTALPRPHDLPGQRCERCGHRQAWFHLTRQPRPYSDEHDITMQRCCAECLTRGERAEIDAARAEAAARALAGEEVVV